MDSAWILTYTGRQFWPLNPKAEDICIEDIAHALSLICRFTGHVRTFYSVAQHCVIASDVVPQEHALAALLHDASEAYLCDLAGPLKRADVMEPYRTAEKALERLICERFNVNIYDPAVRVADERLLFTERRDLLPPKHWIIDENMCFQSTIQPWTSRESEKAFLKRFEALSR